MTFSTNILYTIYTIYYIYTNIYIVYLYKYTITALAGNSKFTFHELTSSFSQNATVLSSKDK